jgi:LAO/AO transport system kinase
MTDLMVLMQLPIAGDDLQAIKKGIVELADLVVINKADLAPVKAAEALQMLRGVLAILRPASPHWRPPVLALSALEGQGIPAFWEEVMRYRRTMEGCGEFAARRRRQALHWMWHLIEDRLRAEFRARPEVAASLGQVQSDVSAGTLSPNLAAERLLALAR